MKKHHILAIGAVLASVVFSGCSQKQVMVAEKGRTLSVSVLQEDTFTKARAINSTNIKLLQVTAEQVLERGYGYFSIVTPAQISNVNGVQANTPKEFIDKCASKSVGSNLAIGVLTLGLAANAVGDDCNLFNGMTGSSKGRSMMSVIMYKEQPLNYMSYDAKAVLEYIKSNNLYVTIDEKPVVKNLDTSVK